MSYQLNQARGIKSQIEMPEMPTELQTEIAQQASQILEVVDNLETTQETTVDTLSAVEQPVESPKPVQESSQEKNFRALREKAERIERERDELLRKYQEIQSSKQSSPAPTNEEVEVNINPDDLVEGKHLNKYDKKIRKLEEQLKNYQQQTTATTIETQLKQQFSDFDKVVSRDNIEALRNSYPELANTLNSSTDLYSKAVSAYTLIKKLGIHQEDLFEADRLQAQKNAAKPRPLASIAPQQGDTPLSKANAFANGLTDDLKLQLRKEMEDARRRM